MAMHVFMTDREYHQSAIDLVARFIFEKAGEIMQGGNLPNVHADSLNCLSLVAISNDLSNTVINTYYDMLVNEIDHSAIFEVSHD